MSTRGEQCILLCKYPFETKHPSWYHRSVNTIVRMYVREEGMRRTWVSYSCIQSIRIMFEVVIDDSEGRAMCVFLCKYPLETGSSGPTQHPSWKHRTVNTIVCMYVKCLMLKLEQKMRSIQKAPLLSFDFDLILLIFIFFDLAHVTNIQINPSKIQNDETRSNKIN